MNNIELVDIVVRAGTVADAQSLMELIKESPSSRVIIQATPEGPSYELILSPRTLKDSEDEENKFFHWFVL